MTYPVNDPVNEYTKICGDEKLFTRFGHLHLDDFKIEWDKPNALVAGKFNTSTKDLSQ